ncbi:MAG TPA: hypothetical protein VGD97_12575 [Lacunisphaera sp.]
MRACRHLLLPALLAGLAPASEDHPATLRDGWELTTLYRFNEAEAVFRALAAKDPSRENRYALAISQLNRQPKSDRTVAEARALLTALVAEPAAPDDEITQAARFYLARILQLHQSKPDLVAARSAYRELSRTPGGGFWAEAASVKWATLCLYEITSWSEKAGRLAETEQEISRLTNPTLQKDLHIILADGYEKFGVSLPAALRHLEAAWALGIERGIDQGDFLARMGELARRTGDRAKARGYFAEFLKRFRRDERVYWITLKLAELEKEAAR